MLLADDAFSRRFSVLGRLGHGAFGEVLEAYDNVRRERVAVKRIHTRKRARGELRSTDPMREVEALQRIQHASVLPLLETVRIDAQTLCLVFERARIDLYALIRMAPRCLSLPVIKKIAQSIFQALDACHEVHLLHRDVKSGNVLLFDDGRVQLADFGLARIVDQEDGNLTHAVASRWYRAPELLYGARRYSSAIDCWGAGMVLAEMLGRGPLIPGVSDIDQLARVVATFGSIRLEDWPDAALLPDYNKIAFHDCAPKDLHLLLPDAPASAINLLKQCFVYNPAQRCTAAEALLHPFFHESPMPATNHDVAAEIQSIHAAWPSMYDWNNHDSDMGVEHGGEGG